MNKSIIVKSMWALASGAALLSLTAVAAAPITKLGAGEGVVDIVAWPGYIERGTTDKNFDWVTDFENKTGCQVRIKTAGTSDEMVALMNEGGFDLVTASGDASLRLIAGKRVQEVSTELIPSWNTIDPRLQNAPWHTVDGKHYGVPYQWGSNVLMYNTNVFKEVPDSWRVVFEEMQFPDGKPNKGRVQAFDGPIYIADAALYLMHHKPELGIKDPYELSEEQYKASLDDGRKTYFEGELIDDLAGHPLLGQTVDITARAYDDFYDPAPDATSPLVAGSADQEIRIPPGVRAAVLVTAGGTVGCPGSLSSQSTPTGKPSRSRSSRS